ncbi:hypothetical protein G3T20_01840 [Bordetella hinzii]|uniref:type VI secretion system protein n=1 Tax=Bordetella hinzii TaxID=103855 RepID=UPI0013EFE050|nr:type VI secretion system protein [Bordetella hinzii]QII83552.1 hypothetical protein G3T20_01840 [Bordetella hinzii]
MLLSNSFFLVSILVLLAAAALGIGVVLYFATRPAGEAAQHKPAVSTWSADAMRAGFHQAVDTIEANLISRAERYSIPWILVMDEGGHGRLPLAHTGMPGVHGSGPALSKQLRWEFFERGVVVDIDVEGLEGEAQGSERPWDQFLALCRGYRPQRPFDGVVLTIPAAMLLDPQARHEIARRAGAMHRRLWLAQNRFAMRLAVYVLVTECEAMDGFSAFARALPDAMRAGMLGWSSPYEPSIAYQSAWVPMAVGEIAATVDDTVAEVLVSRNVAAADMLALTARVRELAPQLQIYLDELMRPNVYHEPFLLRGIYLTGDSGELSALHGESAQDEDARLTPLLQPAFLRDVFERKIFLEYGLTRPARNASLARPFLHKSLRVAAVAVLGGWTLGMVLVAAEAGRGAPRQVAALRDIHEMERGRAEFQDRAEDPPAQWYRRQALSLLKLEHVLRASPGLAVFLPGSWSVFDDLNTTLRQTLAREFAAIVVPAIDQAFAERAAALTSAPLGAGGVDTASAACAAPQGVAQAASGLALEGRADVRAMLAYVLHVERFSRAWQGWQQAGELSSMRDVVQYALGAEAGEGALRLLTGLPAPRDAARQHVYAEAFRCSYDKGIRQLADALFIDNPLLQSERAVVSALSSIGEGDNRADDLRAVVGAISAQQELLSSGPSAWLHEAVFEPDATVTRILTVAAGLPLLGDAVAEQSRQTLREAFRVLRTQLAQYTSGAGLRWQQQENRYVLSDARLALRDSLVGLLAQPFMQVPPPVNMPDLGPTRLARWDVAVLDQALAQVSARTAFLAQGLNAIPANYRPAVLRAMDAEAAQALYRRAVMAIRVESGPAAPLPDFDGVAGRVRRIADALGEQGAAPLQRGLLDLLSQSALAALRRLDEALRTADLYGVQTDLPMGGVSLLGAFGVADLAGFDEYLAQQASRIQELAGQAAIYLAALDRDDARSVVAQRWRAIGHDLERYALRNPNSGLLRLEQWLRGVVQAPDCSSLRLAPGGASEYFGLQQSRLAATLRGYCQGQGSVQLETGWKTFAGDYNARLAGRLPVGDPVAPSRGALPRSAAAPQTVRELVDAFRAVWPAKGEPIAGDGAVAGFARRFSAWADMLQALWPASGQAGYTIAWRFRINRQAEVAGNQIIDWTLSVGSASIGSGTPSERLHWNVGQPITLTVRLAKDAPLIPRPDPRQPRMAVEGPQVRWTFNDPWALFSLLGWQGHGTGGDITPLRFDVPVMVGSLNDLGQLPAAQQLRFFAGLSLYSAADGQPLKWPGVLPQAAPAWGQP